MPEPIKPKKKWKAKKVKPSAKARLTKVKATPRICDVREKQYFAFQLRKKGYSYYEIAPQVSEQYGESCSEATVGNYVRAVLDRMEKQNLEGKDQVRSLELERLDGMMLALEKQIKDGNTFAIQSALKIMERRAKLLGLDAVQKVEHTGEVGIRREYLGIDLTLALPTGAENEPKQIESGSDVIDIVPVGEPDLVSGEPVHN